MTSSEVEVAWWGDDQGTICVTETNSGGCSGEQVCLDVDIIPVNIDELGEVPFIVYPSPATSTLNIRTINQVDQAIIQIRDTSGRLVYTSSMNRMSTVDVSSLARGTYLVKLISGDSQSQFRRVVLH